VAGTTIFHNPACSKSRKVLDALRASCAEPVVVEYLLNPPDRVALLRMAADMGVPLRGLLRQKAEPYTALGLDDARLTDDALLDAIERHPVLIERPIVVTPLGTRLCRPAERLAEILRPQRG
jgi:arsenate reductase